MGIKNKFFKFIHNPEIRFGYLARLGFLNYMSDRKFIEKEYYYKFGVIPNLDEPLTFNEKIQWLKINDRRESYALMVDKFEAKEYVAKKIGKEYIIPTIGIYEKFNDIDFDKLPDRFVIKCTHDSGGIVICRNKDNFNIELARKTINKYLRRRYYYIHREWPYKNVRPRIIVEKYIENKNSEPLVDYKLFCFNGSPEIILVCSERFSNDGLKETWFSGNWELLPIIEGGHNIDPTVKKPLKLEEMKKLAGIIAKDMTFLRVDFYEIDGRILFGELTFSPCAGYERFSPESWDRRLGDMIDLSVLKKEKND